MTDAARYDALTAALVSGVRDRDGLTGLALVGSSSEAGRPRRDEWSDHDFFAIVEPGRGAEVRPQLDWLPDEKRIVLTAREGGIGFVAVYDDGHVLEFAVAEASELAGAVAGDASVVVDDEDGSTAALIARGRSRAEADDVFDPENDVRLVLVKLLIGVGRVRRGEVVNGGQFVRTWAVNHLLRAIRGRLSGEDPTSRDRIDPTRRFERDHPRWAAEIADALERPAEEAAREILAITRRALEPGWDAFPTRAADVVAARLGWSPR